MKKMSEFLDLPVEPAFRETQVILTGKRRAIGENAWKFPVIQHLKCVSADGSKAFCLRRERKNDSWFCKIVRYRRTA